MLTNREARRIELAANVIEAVSSYRLNAPPPAWVTSSVWLALMVLIDHVPRKELEGFRRLYCGVSGERNSDQIIRMNMLSLHGIAITRAARDKLAAFRQGRAPRWTG
jgi:hypothetical protein